MKKLILVLAVLMLVAGLRGCGPLAALAFFGGDEAIARACQSHQSGVQVTGEGTVVEVLPDDNDGSRHQRFVLKLDSGQTVLIAHNIDLASRIHALRVGERVGFHGAYEWNSEGGVVHWTHGDPRGKHAAGWLRRR